MHGGTEREQRDGKFSVGVVVHPTKDVDRSLDEIEQWASEHGVSVVIRDVDATRMADRRSFTVLPEHEFAREVNGVVSLGGDGTMLGAMRLLAERPVPIMGVNHGNLGFLVEVEPDLLPSALARLVDGNFVLESYGCLDIHRPTTPIVDVAFNDVVVTRAAGGSAVVLNLEVNGVRYGYYRSDAVIISTPTGSTAYNYAAGGPVLSPSHQAVAVTPVAPMSGISRTVVFGPGDDISLHVPESEAPALVFRDGLAEPDLEQNETLSTRLRADASSVVRMDAESHARRGRVKLSLLDLPLPPDQLLDLVPVAVRDRMRSHLP